MDPFDLMQSFMQVSMVEDDKPLELENDNEASTDDNVAQNNEDVLKLPKAFPSMDITAEEMEYYQKTFEDLETIKVMKIHCTSCNQHLGSAPIDQKQRHEHPLLKVIVCGSCRDFYLSGDFTQDKDGSELYCRWCGEGGQVYCCANCPFVFCKKCIKRNISQDMVVHIENSDDWVCYACNPKDIWFLRAQNWAIKEYSALKIKNSSGDDFEIFQDCCQCCKGRGRKPNLSKPEPKKSEPKSTERPSEPPKPRKRRASTPPNLLTASKIAKHLTDIPPMAPLTETTNFVSPPVPPVVPSPARSSVSPVAPIEPINIEPISLPPMVPLNSKKQSTSDVISVDDSPPASPKTMTAKKNFLQVKPTSELLQPKTSMQSPVSVKAIKYPPTLSLTSTNLQKHPVILGMIAEMQKRLKPGDQTKLIKVASPDGRVFFIDPLKMPRVDNINLPATPQTTSKVPIAMTWFHDAVMRTQEISQFISSKVIEMVSEEKKCNSSNDHFLLYSHCQTKFKKIISKLQESAKKMEEEYHAWFLSHNKSGACIQINSHQNNSFYVSEKSLNDTIEIEDSNVSTSNENSVHSEVVNSNPPENVSNDTTSAADINSENVKRIKRRLLKVEKALSMKNSNSEKKKRKEPHQPRDEIDEIFDCDVTCDSDAEDNLSDLTDDDDNESVLSINSSDSGSDCVILNSNNDNEVIHSVDSPPRNGKSSVVTSRCSSRNSVNNIEQTEEKNGEQSPSRINSENSNDEEAISKVNSDNGKETNEESPKDEESTKETNDEQSTDKINLDENSADGSIISLLGKKIVDEVDDESLNLIAKAIRESLIEAKSGNTEPIDDLEKILDSNVVYRNNKKERTEEKKSFVDAFSNFVASGSDSLPVETEISENDEISTNNNENIASCSRNGPKNPSDLLDQTETSENDEISTINTENNISYSKNGPEELRDSNYELNENIEIASKIDELQKLAENCIQDNEDCL